MSAIPGGVVYLVGAGPGDPALLTLRAAELLRTVDVVAHDALISDAVLAMVGADVELIAVGHRGKGSASAPYRIHPDVIERARAGLRVVRLKQGDPFIFGRGGEEAEELRAAGIAFEVVPGVSAALGAAAYAGIPLTHRLVSSDVTFATGHDLLTGTPSRADWSPPAGGRRSGTMVLFMAARKLAENLARLVASGYPPSTAAAYIASATTAGQRTIVGTLADLVERTRGVDRDEVALIIVGEVVSLRAGLAWIEERPLFGRRVLVARARPGESSIAARLRALGAEVVEAPILETAPLEDPAALDAALGQAREYDGVVFGCAESVTATLQRLGASGLDVRAVLDVPLVAVGAQAAARLRDAALQPTVALDGACADAVGVLGDRRWLLVTGDHGRPALVSELAAIGATVDTVAAYRMLRRYPRSARDRFDLVVVPSSTAASAIYSCEYGAGLTGVPVVALGPSSEAAARRGGAARVHRSDLDSVDAAVTKVRELLIARPSAAPPVDEARPS